MVLRLISRSPRRPGSFATVAREYGLPAPGRADQTSANLTPASGRQDHTTSPYAAAPFVSSPFDRSQISRPALHHVARLTLPRPPHPTPRFVTIMIRPSFGLGWEKF